MKVAAFSKNEVLSGITGFDPANTVFFRFYEPYKKDRVTDDDSAYENYAGGYIFYIRDLDFAESTKHKVSFDDYIPEIDALANCIFKEFLRGRDIAFRCYDGVRISGAFATATIDVFRTFRDDIVGECYEGYNEYTYKKAFDMLSKLKREEYTIL